MLEGLDLDPHVVLGLGRGASSEEIREAYHKKSKKHHPDHGGDDWAFQIVVRSYEVMSRIAERERLAAIREAPDTGRIRPGVHDKGVSLTRLVHVEMVWMRYEVEDMLNLLAAKPEDRNLSGSLEINWPSAELADQAETLPNALQILKALNAAFDELKAKTRPTGARSQIEGGKFAASLGYSNGHAAWDAFKIFHVGLKARGLGAKQWTRDVTLPRED